MLLLDELLEMLGDNPHHLYIETKHVLPIADVDVAQLVPVHLCDAAGRCP